MELQKQLLESNGVGKGAVVKLWNWKCSCCKVMELEKQLLESDGIAKAAVVM